MAPPRLVIFDCDGVLVDSEPIANRHLHQAILAEGLEESLEAVIARYVGLSMASVTADLEQRLGRALPAGWLDRLQQATYAAFRRDLAPIKGARAALEGLAAAGIGTCVASSGAPEKMRLTLGLTGLLPLVDGRLYSASQVARGKPHPDLFLHAARQMGSAPETCVVIEDSRFGIQAARAAGMRALGYAGRGDGAALAAAGASVFADLAALPDLLGLAGN